LSRKKFTSYKTLGQRLQEVREKLHLTYDEVAAEVGCSPGYLSHLEKGVRTNPRPVVAQAIEEWLARARSEAADDEPDEDQIYRAVEEVRASPEHARQVRGLLRILRDGGEFRRIGIESNIRAFLGEMELEERKRRDGELGAEGRASPGPPGPADGEEKTGT
jgi:transcriptional regulator with XRE-family HTH domain